MSRQKDVNVIRTFLKVGCEKIQKSIRSHISLCPLKDGRYYWTFHAACFCHKSDQKLRKDQSKILDCHENSMKSDQARPRDSCTCPSWGFLGTSKGAASDPPGTGRSSEQAYGSHCCRQHAASHAPVRTSLNQLLFHGEGDVVYLCKHLSEVFRCGVVTALTQVGLHLVPNLGLVQVPGVLLLRILSRRGVGRPWDLVDCRRLLEDLIGEALGRGKDLSVVGGDEVLHKLLQLLPVHLQQCLRDWNPHRNLQMVRMIWIDFVTYRCTLSAFLILKTTRATAWGHQKMSREPQLQVTEVTLHLQQMHLAPMLFDVRWMELK